MAKTDNKKRKRAVVVHQGTENGTDLTPQKRRRGQDPAGAANEELDTSKPTAVFQPKKGRPWTLSIALPGSFITNVRTYDQKAALACRIARACAVFCIDEIIVFDDDPSIIPDRSFKSKADALAHVSPEDEPWHNPDQFLFHLLGYLETPPHLRRGLFEHHPNLKGAGTFTSLDMPHHMKADEWCQYREGVTVAPPYHAKPGHSYVDCGLSYPVKIPVEIPPGTRVTLKFATQTAPASFPNLSEHDVEMLDAEAVDPSEPREDAGYYWGYSVRRAACLSDVYTECPHEAGYDISIGTSERGVPLSSILPNQTQNQNQNPTTPQLPSSFSHMLLVFGGVAGLEPAIVGDRNLAARGLTKETAKEVFDFWVNLVPGQGSRTIRTEEAVWIALMGLRGYVEGVEG